MGIFFTLQRLYGIIHEMMRNRNLYSCIRLLLSLANCNVNQGFNNHGNEKGNNKNIEANNEYDHLQDISSRNIVIKDKKNNTVVDIHYNVDFLQTEKELPKMIKKQFKVEDGSVSKLNRTEKKAVKNFTDRVVQNIMSTSLFYYLTSITLGIDIQRIIDSMEDYVVSYCNALGVNSERIRSNLSMLFILIDSIFSQTSEQKFQPTLAEEEEEFRKQNSYYNAISIESNNNSPESDEKIMRDFIMFIQGKLSQKFSKKTEQVTVEQIAQFLSELLKPLPLKMVKASPQKDFDERYQECCAEYQERIENARLGRKGLETAKEDNAKVFIFEDIGVFRTEHCLIYFEKNYQGLNKTLLLLVPFALGTKNCLSREDIKKNIIRRKILSALEKALVDTKDFEVSFPAWDQDLKVIRKSMTIKELAEFLKLRTLINQFITGDSVDINSDNVSLSMDDEIDSEEYEY